MIIIDKIPKINEVTVNGVALNDRDFHCIARLFQSAFFAPENNTFFGCYYCKYSYECTVNTKKNKADLSNFNMVKLMWRFREITGVNTGPAVDKNQFYHMSIQELYPEKFKRIADIIGPKHIKEIERLEKKYFNEERKSSRKADRYDRIVKGKGIWRFKPLGKLWLFADKYLVIIKRKIKEL